MDVLWHEDKRMQFVAAFATMPVKCFQEKPDVRLDDEHSPAMPGREGYEVGSRRGDEPSRLQSKPQRLEAASFAQTKSARVELVPFPVIFCCEVFVLGNGSAVKPSRRMCR
jgi:hypothetical protein